QRDREVRLARARRAEQHHVLLAQEEVQLRQMQHEVLLDRALERPIELFERHARQEARRSDARVAAVGLTRARLARKERLGEALIAPLLGARTLGELGQGPRRGGRLERSEEVSEFGRRTHAGMSAAYRARGRRSTSMA